MSRQTPCQKFTNGLVKYLSIFSIFSTSSAPVQAKNFLTVTPLNNLNSMECQQMLTNGSDTFPTVIAGSTGCPNYEQLLPTFEEACAQSERDCYSFNFTDETNPGALNCALNSITVQSCLGYTPMFSPLLSQYFLAKDPSLGAMAMGPINLGGGINGNSTVKEVTNFMDTTPDTTQLRLRR